MILHLIDIIFYFFQFTLNWLANWFILKLRQHKKNR